MKKIFLIFLIIPAFIFSDIRFFKNPAPPRNPIEVVKEYLNLSDEQVQIWIGLLEDFRATQKEISEQIRPLEQTLKDILNSENPDPAMVGNLVIQIDNLRKEMRENLEIYREDFLILLNEEQLERYFVLSEAFELAPLFPAFQETELI